MSITQRLDVRQTQTLVMTPQLRQAIKLLQMSNQELGSYVAEEIEKNPLLERAGESGETAPETAAITEYVPTEPETVSAAGPSSAVQPGPSQSGPSLPGAQQSGDVWDKARLADAPADYAGGTSARGGSFDDDDDYSATKNVAAGTSLREHLLGQIHVDFADPAERMIAAALMELLDEAGYLPDDLGLARTQLGASPELFESVIARLQRLDPPGIFARSLTECLSVQLRDKNRLDPAMQTLLQHLDLVAKRENRALMKLCAVDAEDLSGMITEIRALNPKPAMAFASDAAPPVTPDVLLFPQPGGGWRVELNGDNLPRVLANERYYADVRGGARSKSDKDYLSERWQQANWLVKALHQRATTIVKVAAEIVRQQDKFFIYGVQHLRPLILRDIAAAVEMHESTVSRVTQNKYIATPRGLFELKYFFSNAIATTGGDDSVSALAVRARIRALVDAETPDAVLSDDRIMALLRAEGIDLARRTVAKYRETLRIPSSAQRRREKREG
ncbi:MAG: RNA polymerase factor sigma-54 [Alphaproteobacteria bacterium]|nr:RNA polymerase factor sigma-54 [Alphaproteobacteria bacterium]